MNDIIFIFLIVNLSSNEYSSHISQIMNSSTWIIISMEFLKAEVKKKNYHFFDEYKRFEIKTEEADQSRFMLRMDDDDPIRIFWVKNIQVFFSIFQSNFYLKFVKI